MSRKRREKERRLSPASKANSREGSLCPVRITFFSDLRQGRWEGDRDGLDIGLSPVRQQELFGWLLLPP